MNEFALFWSGRRQTWYVVGEYFCNECGKKLDVALIKAYFNSHHIKSQSEILFYCGNEIKKMRKIEGKQEQYWMGVVIIDSVLALPKDVVMSIVSPEGLVCSKQSISVFDAATLNDGSKVKDTTNWSKDPNQSVMNIDNKPRLLIEELPNNSTPLIEAVKFFNLVKDTVPIVCGVEAAEVLIPSIMKASLKIENKGQ